MRRVRLLAVLATLALPVAGALAQEPASPPVSDLTQRRHALIGLVAEYQDYEDYRPERSEAEIAAKRGEDPFAKIGDLSEKATAARLAKARGFLPRFEAVDTTGFPEHEVLNKILMVRELKLEIEGERFLPMPVNQLSGVHLWAPNRASLPPRPILQDFEALLSRYRQIPAVFDQTIALMRKGMVAGVMPPRYLLRKWPGRRTRWRGCPLRLHRSARRCPISRPICPRNSAGRSAPKCCR